MYLAYFDDCGSEPSSGLCVFGGVVIPGDAFGHAEAHTQVVVEHLGLADSFEEFKAVDLYFGQRAFASVKKERCREAFLVLLNQLTVHRYPFIYSAIDREQLKGGITVSIWISASS